MKTWILGLAFLTLPFTARAVAVAELINSILMYHPLQQQLDEGELQQYQKVMAANAAFDPVFRQQTQLRPGGYYDGAFASQQMRTPLSSVNGYWYSEYRIADGRFPVYEQQYATLGAGEVAVGVEIPLWRDRATDSRRLAVANTRLDTREFAAARQLQSNRLVYDGVSTYLTWQETTAAMQVINALEGAMQQLLDGVKRQVARGDAPQVALTEVSQSLLELEARTVSLRYQQRVAARTLSYFWRDPNGQPQLPDSLHANGHNNGVLHRWPFALPGPDALADLTNALAQHPVLQKYDAQLQRLRNEQQLARNALKPRLDLKAEVARDVGGGPLSLHGTESKLAVTFSYPLGNTKAKSDRAIAASKLRQTRIERSLAQEQLSQQFEIAIMEYQRARQALTLARQTEAGAQTLADAEFTRYAAGDTDWFTLNAQENKRVESALRTVYAQFSVYRSELTLHMHAAALPVSR